MIDNSTVFSSSPLVIIPTIKESLLQNAVLFEHTVLLHMHSAIVHMVQYTR